MVWPFLCVWVAVLLLAGGVHGGEVTYDGRSLLINGTRSILFSGSIHYPRSTPEMWPRLIAKAKEGGLDVIDTYVFWNVHEPEPGQFNFKGRFDIVRFLKEIQAQGLYVCLRIGPFIESEWTYGGLPFWLHDVPGIVYRSDNEPFKYHMQKFTTSIVNKMKQEGLFASQGGPIILAQIENEYGNVEGAFHGRGPPYVQWAAKMAVDLQTGVPWVMCKQDDAPDPVINSCNGLSCGETWSGPNSPNKPALWTENWTQLYQAFGEDLRGRPAENIAFAVALFVAKKGSYVNYYMYHGGTNFGRSGSSYVTTSYYDEAPLDEYGMVNQPTWGHLTELHEAIKKSSETLLFGHYQKISLGDVQLEAYVFEGTSGGCVAFLSNGNRRDATVQFHEMSYELPARSVSFLPDCKNVTFNTAKVSAPRNGRSVSLVQKLDASGGWEEFKEAIPTFGGTSLREDSLLEQMATTNDKTDYLWYTFNYNYKSTGNQSVLLVESRAHVLHAFVNGVLVGTAHGNHNLQSFSFENPISLKDGNNDISLLSVMVGLPDAGAYMEHKVSGLCRVRIQGTAEGTSDFGHYKWGYEVGLSGQKLGIYKHKGSRKVVWKNSPCNCTHQPLVWYKAKFDTPQGNDSIALDLCSMGKGEAWVNGNSIGRYWVSFLTPKGVPSQTLYHVPRSFLNSKGNLLVLFEEVGGDPTKISVKAISRNNI
ncbi:beta-galactosidase 6 [Aristolochia californica]|uniref:beta-galactosidase 6 n=1 Tax=Aristolochia californica TaxID=171875 RepID=UPI0035E16B76